MKIALAMIVKGDDQEAVFLKRCLENISPFVDGIFATVTHRKGEDRNAAVGNVLHDLNMKNGNVFTNDFEWSNDFAAARNYSFKDIPKDYDYILWCDADDIFQNPDKIRPLIEENPNVDAFAFWYYYQIDVENNPVVIHKKTQIVRNDGCVSWVGKLHEDFRENRALNVKFVEGIQRIHLTTDEHVKVAQSRNVEISKQEAESNPNDPRVYFNLANSYFGAGQATDAEKVYLKFLDESQSDDEKYIALQRLSACEKTIGNKQQAIECLLLAIGMFPEIPDAYNQIGYLYFEYGMLDLAERYLLLGLPIKPPYHKMIVFNPRDYDYNPFMALAKIYFNKSRPDYALPLLKKALLFYPNDAHIKELVDMMEKELRRLEQVVEVIKRIDTFGGDKLRIMTEINLLPKDLQSHPAICRIRNEHLVKETSTGKDIAYYCGETVFDWNPDLFKVKGFGGSEEAVINLAKEWATSGYNVTVFNSCGVEVMERDGVTYKPFWHYNSRDKYDYTILWRTPRLADHPMNTGKLYIDMHDVIAPGEFNEKRMARIDKIFVKTQAHRDLFPLVPDDKIAIIPNGIDFGLFKKKVKRNPMMLVNTSSPDRSLDVLPELFRRVKDRVPKARLKWAYGWDNWDNTFKNDRSKMDWKEKIIREMKEAGIEDMGRLSQSECAKLYLEGAILAYPTEFYEIDCISVKKAQAGGCVPVTTDFAALKESNKYGYQVHSTKNMDDWNKPYQFHFGIDDEEVKKAWVDTAVYCLQNPYIGERTDAMKEWAKSFDWNLIAEKWCNIFTL